MKLLRTKVWDWWDVWLLKGYAFLLGIAAGAYFHACIINYVWMIFIVAVLLAIRPAIAYWKN